MPDGTVDTAFGEADTIDVTTTAGEVLHIELPGIGETSGDLLLQVYDSRGSLVMHQKTDAYTLAAGLPLPVGSQGVYFVKVSHEEGRYVGKVLVLE